MEMCGKISFNPLYRHAAHICNITKINVIFLRELEKELVIVSIFQYYSLCKFYVDSPADGNTELIFSHFDSSLETFHVSLARINRNFSEIIKA